jgi:hypothetical protein
MNANKYYLITIILIAIILSSCSGNNNNGIDETELKIGTTGLQINVPDKNILEVIEENNAYLNFQIHNQGAYNIEEGILVPSYEKDYLEIESWEMPSSFKNSENIITYDIEGKSKYMKKGEIQIASIVLKARNIDDTLNKIESSIILNSCYKYSTILSKTICIDTDPYNQNVVKKVCQVSDISTTSGQGAPVAITKVEQKVIPGNSVDSVRVQFTIHAKNVDNGIILNDNNYKQVCTGEKYTKEDYNIIKIKSLKFSDYEYPSEIKCSFDTLKETEGDYYTVCTLNEEYSIPKTMLTFETPLTIELSYGYKISEPVKIEISNKNKG